MNDENATNSERPIMTHFSGCWREPGHHGCAVAEVERMREYLKQTEWQEHLGWAARDIVAAYCQYCLVYSDDLHAPDCPVFHPDGDIKEQGE